MVDVQDKFRTFSRAFVVMAIAAFLSVSAYAVNPNCSYAIKNQLPGSLSKLKWGVANPELAGAWIALSEAAYELGNRLPAPLLQILRGIERGEITDLAQVGAEERAQILDFVQRSPARERREIARILLTELGGTESSVEQAQSAQRASQKVSEAKQRGGIGGAIVWIGGVFGGKASQEKEARLANCRFENLVQFIDALGKLPDDEVIEAIEDNLAAIPGLTLDEVLAIVLPLPTDVQSGAYRALKPEIFFGAAGYDFFAIRQEIANIASEKARREIEKDFVPVLSEAELGSAILVHGQNLDEWLGDKSPVRRGFEVDAAVARLDFRAAHADHPEARLGEDALRYLLGRLHSKRAKLAWIDRIRGQGVVDAAVLGKVEQDVSVGAEVDGRLDPAEFLAELGQEGVEGAAKDAAIDTYLAARVPEGSLSVSGLVTVLAEMTDAELANYYNLLYGSTRAEAGQYENWRSVMLRYHAFRNAPIGAATHASVIADIFGKLIEHNQISVTELGEALALTARDPDATTSMMEFANYYLAQLLAQDGLDLRETVEAATLLSAYPNLALAALRAYERAAYPQLAEAAPADVLAYAQFAAQGGEVKLSDDFLMAYADAVAKLNLDKRLAQRFVDHAIQIARAASNHPTHDYILYQMLIVPHLRSLVEDHGATLTSILHLMSPGDYLDAARNSIDRYQRGSP